MPLLPFDIRFKDIDVFDEKKIFRHEIERGDISFSQYYERVLIAHWDNQSLWEFDEKPEWYQGYIAQAYRGKQQMEAVIAEDQRIKEEQRRKEQEARSNAGIR